VFGMLDGVRVLNRFQSQRKKGEWVEVRNLWVATDVKSLFLVFMDNLFPLCKVIIAKT
jgi:hypothetical protein